jgi:hypothetical protein
MRYQVSSGVSLAEAALGISAMTIKNPG